MQFGKGVATVTPVPKLDELLAWARTEGFSTVRHPPGEVQVPGGETVTWAELAAALGSRAVAHADAPLSMSETVRAYNESLPVEVRGYAFIASEWNDSLVTVVRGGQVVSTMRANDSEMLTDVLTVIRKSFLT